MNRRIEQIFVFIAVTLVPHVFANPVPEVLFTELLVTQESWQLEMHSEYGEFDLTGMFLTTNTDTAFFKDGIQVDSVYLVITPDSLESSLYLDPNGDCITLHTADSMGWLSIAYGDGGHSMPVAPLPHQSICFDWNAWCYYLDNTPTLGSPNDTANARGHVYGTVTDTLGNPLGGAEVHGWGVDTTDSAGNFHWYGWACFFHFYCVKENYQTQSASVMVYPDSSVYVAVEMIPTVHTIDGSKESTPGSYYLSPNYPNPFNSSTEFTYTLPWDTPLEVVVYNLAGRLVDRLYRGDQQAGEYRLRWVTHDLPSSVYIIQLRTPTELINRKAVLLK